MKWTSLARPDTGQLTFVKVRYNGSTLHSLTFEVPSVNPEATFTRFRQNRYPAAQLRHISAATLPFVQQVAAVFKEPQSLS